MFHGFITLICFYFCFCVSTLNGLNREYDTTGPRCNMHLQPFIKRSELNPNLLYLIPAVGGICHYIDDKNQARACPGPSIYQGYYDPDYRKYRRHLNRHLEYCDKNKDCRCYWPECSQKAAEINDLAYKLFNKLLCYTELYQLYYDQDIQFEFLEIPTFLELHGLTIAFIARQFHFSDYIQVCQDIEDYAIRKFDSKNTSKIKDKLEDILATLYPKFLELYKDCLSKHRNPEIEQEIRFMKLLVNDISGLKILEASSKNVFSHQSEFLLEQGVIFNNLLLYNKAIETLTHAIVLNPTNRNAYIERAIAYFETDQLILALQDYQKAKNLNPAFSFYKKNTNSDTLKAIYVPENKLSFSQGLLMGTIAGGHIGITEIVPSLLSCCRGILNGLWAFACAPVEVSEEMIDTAYALGEYISSTSKEEYLQFVVPELKDLSTMWEKLDDHGKGHGIGYLIGKYGFEIFAPCTTIKGINKLKAAKRANTMLTLENCAVSSEKKAKVVEKSLKYVDARNKVLITAEKGKILTRSSNIQYHVLQKKHAWDKVINLSGNVGEDFKKVALLLEESAILSEKNFLVSEVFAEGKVIRSDYKKIINGHEIMATFETYIDTNQTFLKDAWVVTK